MADEPTWLTVAEVAQLLRISKMTVHRMIEAEEIPAIRVGVPGGGVIRIPRAALAEYLAGAWIGGAPDGYRTEDFLGEAPDGGADVVELRARAEP